MENLETQVKNLAELVALPMAHRPASWLIGWIEICAFCRRPKRTLSRYQKGLAFPAYRLGGHVVSHPYLLNDWLRELAVARAEAKRKANPLAALNDDELRARLKELNKKLER